MKCKLNSVFFFFHRTEELNECLDQKKNHLANVLILCISSYPQQGRKNKHSYLKKSALFHLLVTALHERHPDLSLYCWSHHSRSHVVSVSFETLNKMSPGIERKVCGPETPFSRRKKIIFGKRSTMKLTQT